ncbi:outer membrane protein assembly factor BamB family protein [Streptosporangium sp. NPDC003464]
MTDQHNGNPYGGQPAPDRLPNWGQPVQGSPGHGRPPSGGPAHGPGNGQPPLGQPAHGPGYGQPSPGQPVYGPPGQGGPAYGRPGPWTPGPPGPAPHPQGYPSGPPYPYQQPHPQQPGGWDAPPPPPPPQRKKGHTALFVALGLVVLLAVGAGTAWFVAGTGPGAGQDGGQSVGPAAAEQWSVPLVNADSTDFTSGLAFAAWLTDTTVVRAQRDGLLAYDLKTGKRAWGVPSPGEQLCGATAELAAGKGAVAYGSARLCDHLAGVDTAKGQITWKVKIPAEKSTLSDMLAAPKVMNAAGMAVVAVDETVYGYRLSDGARQWTAAPPEGCHLDDVNAAATRVVLILDCAFNGTSNRVEVLDPESGRPVKRYPLGELGLGPKVLSADPVIVHVEKGGQSTFTAFDDNGGKVDIRTGHVDLLAMNKVAFFDGMAEQRRYAVHGDRLYLATFPENVPGELRSRNTAVSFDLKTGKQLWESSGTQNTKLTYIRADDKGLLALEVGDRRDLAPRLVRLDAGTGKATVIAGLPQEFGTEGDNARVFERGGAVIIVPWTSVATKNAVSYVTTGAS